MTGYLILILVHTFDVGNVEFEALEASLDGLADVELPTLSDGQVHRTLVELIHQQTRLTALTTKLAEV